MKVKTATSRQTATTKQTAGKQQQPASELKQDFAHMQSQGKKIYNSLSNIAKNLDWKDYAKIGVAGAVMVYGYRKRSMLASLAAPVVISLAKSGIEKAIEGFERAKELKHQIATA